MAAKKKTAAKKTTGAKKKAARKTAAKRSKRAGSKRKGSAGLVASAPSSAPSSAAKRKGPRKAGAKRAATRRGGQAANMALPAGQRLVGVHAHRGKTIALVRRGGRVSAYLTGDPALGRMAAADMLSIGEPRRTPGAALDDARQHIDRVLAGMAPRAQS